MRGVLETLGLGLILGLALAQVGCRSDSRPWAPPEDRKVTIASDALFLRTKGGDYVDGYLADYEWEFQKQRLFLALELTPYLKGDRLDVTGRFTGDTVRVSIAGRPAEEVRVFEVERAKPNIPDAPDIPAIK
jgi:hypothetical protein